MERVKQRGSHACKGEITLPRLDAGSCLSAGSFYQRISMPTGRKILRSNSSQHPLESPWMRQCAETPPSTLEACPTSVEKKKEVSYEDANKDVVKRKTSDEALVSTKLPYQRRLYSSDWVWVKSPERSESLRIFFHPGALRQSSRMKWRPGALRAKSPDHKKRIRRLFSGDFRFFVAVCVSKSPEKAKLPDHKKWPKRLKSRLRGKPSLEPRENEIGNPFFFAQTLSWSASATPIRVWRALGLWRRLLEVPRKREAVGSHYSRLVRQIKLTFTAFKPRWLI